MTSVQAGLGLAAPADRPGPLTNVLRIVEGTGRASAAALASDVHAWLASPDGGLSAAIESARGAAAATDALERLAPSSLTVLGAAASDRVCWAEIVRRAGGGDETCVVGASVDAAGQISRVLLLRVPLVPGGTPDSGAAVPDARPILQRYFADLMSSRFRDAAGHFTVDTIYSHPPYAGGRERVLFEGREALWRGFAEERGPSPARQIITDLHQHGSRVFVEGVIEGIPRGGSFFSTAQITPEGEIARYVAFYVASRMDKTSRLPAELN
jgi:hypothetical protein